MPQLPHRQHPRKRVTALRALVGTLADLHDRLFSEPPHIGITRSQQAYAIQFIVTAQKKMEVSLIAPRQLYAALAELVSHGPEMDQEEQEIFISAAVLSLAAHELRHKLVHRGMVTHFDESTIDQLALHLHPPEAAGRYIQAFHDFTEERGGDQEEGDAHMIEIMVWDLAYSAWDTADPYQFIADQALRVLLLSAN